MVKVSSSSGGTVDVQITGIIDTINGLRNFYSMLPTKEGIILVQYADMVKNEVKESIIGNRGEPKSVDTGNFANSIQIRPEGDNVLAVYTDVEYAKFLEYGTSVMEPRAHFQNTAFRVAPEVEGIAIIEIEKLKKESFK